VTALIEKSSDRGVLRARLYQQRAFLNARLEQWTSSAEDFLEAKNREPDDTMHWMRAGVMLLLAGDMAKYREHTQEMLKRFEHPPNAYVAERTAKLCVLPTEPIGDKETVSRLAEFATENSEDSPWSMYFPMTEALVKYRYGDYDAALRLIDASRARKRPGQVRPDVAEMLDHVIEALCWAAIGDHQRAEAALGKADEYLQPFVERPLRVDDSTQHGWFIARMLYDEAKSLNRSQ
jgi:tetratricopeptide (TPR) repeat protein